MEWIVDARQSDFSRVSPALTTSFTDIHFASHCLLTMTACNRNHALPVTLTVGLTLTA